MSSPTHNLVLAGRFRGICSANVVCHHLLPSNVQVGGRTGVEGPGLSNWQRGCWGVGTVFVRYAWSRLDQIAAAQHWGDIDSPPAVQRGWAVRRSCETGLNLASLLNFLVFLQQGKYRYKSPVHVLLALCNFFQTVELVEHAHNSLYAGHTRPVVW